MSPETEKHCPNCGTEETFWLAARTHIHMGEKAKWSCTECEYTIVEIGDEVDTAAMA